MFTTKLQPFGFARLQRYRDNEIEVFDRALLSSVTVLASGGIFQTSECKCSCIYLYMACNKIYQSIVECANSAVEISYYGPTMHELRTSAIDAIRTQLQPDMSRAKASSLSYDCSSRCQERESEFYWQTNISGLLYIKSLVLVISPLRSLIVDQVVSLKKGVFQQLFSVEAC